MDPSFRQSAVFQWIAVGVTIVFVFGIAFAVLRLKKWLRNRSYARRGALTQARVVAIDVHRAHIGGYFWRVDRVFVTYEFSDRSGKPVRETAKLSFLSFEGATRYAAAHPAESSFTAWFDPKNPQKHLVLTRRLVASLRVGAALLLPGGAVLIFARFWMIAGFALFVGVSLHVLIVAARSWAPSG